MTALVYVPICAIFVNGLYFRFFFHVLPHNILQYLKYTFTTSVYWHKICTSVNGLLRFHLLEGKMRNAKTH